MGGRPSLGAGRPMGTGGMSMGGGMSMRSGISMSGGMGGGPSRRSQSPMGGSMGPMGGSMRPMRGSMGSMSALSGGDDMTGRSSGSQGGSETMTEEEYGSAIGANKYRGESDTSDMMTLIGSQINYKPSTNAKQQQKQKKPTPKAYPKVNPTKATQKYTTPSTTTTYSTTPSTTVSTSTTTTTTPRPTTKKVEYEKKYDDDDDEYENSKPRRRYRGSDRYHEDRHLDDEYENDRRDSRRHHSEDDDEYDGNYSSHNREHRRRDSDREGGYRKRRVYNHDHDYVRPRHYQDYPSPPATERLDIRYHRSDPTYAERRALVIPLSSERVMMKYSNEGDKIANLPVNLHHVVGEITQGLVEGIGRNVEVTAEIERIKRQRKVESMTGVPVYPKRARFIPIVSGIGRIPYVAPNAAPYHKSVPLYPEAYPYEGPNYGMPSKKRHYG